MPEALARKDNPAYRLNMLYPQSGLPAAFSQPEKPAATPAPRSLEYLILSGAVLLMLTAAALTFTWRLSPSGPAFPGKLSAPWGRAFLAVSLVLVACRVGFLLYMLVLFRRYRPVAPVTDTLLPTCTVIVPAYNEGQLVYQTLLSLAAGDYPADKVQLIAIDDGSRDDTWTWMCKAKAVLGRRLEIYQQPENRGKRHALYRGFNLADGEVLVTVDSDSIVKKDTLRQLVSPFVANPRCGAVAGNVRVLNDHKAFIPKMLNVSFAFGFEFMRSAQSTLGSVLCTPGALAAYRKDAAMACLPQWIRQRFRGQLSDIGEDRAMTNMILKQGYQVLFQRDAHVLTNTPEKYRGLYKMFTRWERSNVRENIMMSKFAFGKFRQGPKAGTRILLLNQWQKILLSYPMTLLMLLFVFTNPLLFLCSTLTGILIYSSVQACFYARKHGMRGALWAYPYSIFYAFSLFWITPYAIATAGKRGWLTRNLPEEAQSARAGNAEAACPAAPALLC